jgi:hypothetical protein
MSEYKSYIINTPTTPQTQSGRESTPTEGTVPPSKGEAAPGPLITPPAAAQVKPTIVTPESQVAAIIRLRQHYPGNSMTHKKMRSRMTISAAGAGAVVPNRMRSLLSYADMKVFNPGTHFVFHEYRLNSLFDPDYTSAGHQPTGFDQWMTLYQNYIVRRARVNITAMTHGNEREYIISTLGTATAASSTIATMLQKPFSLNVGYGGTGCPPALLHRDWVDLAQFFGMSESEYVAEQRFWGSATSNPVEQLLDSLLFIEANNGSVNVRGNYQIRIDYDVEFFTRVNLTSS